MIRAAHDTESSTYYPAYSSWLNFGESYVSTILENLQVEVNHWLGVVGVNQW